MDKAIANRLVPLIQTALNAALKPEGFEAQVTGGTFTADTALPTVVIKPIGLDLDKAAFERYAGLFGLQASDYKREVTSGKKKYRVVSLVPGNKYCVVGVELRTGKRYNLTRDCLNQLKTLVVGTDEWKTFVADAAAKHPKDRTAKEREALRLMMEDANKPDGATQ